MAALPLIRTCGMRALHCLHSRTWLPEHTLSLPLITMVAHLQLQSLLLTRGFKIQTCPPTLEGMEQLVSLLETKGMWAPALRISLPTSMTSGNMMESQGSGRNLATWG